MEVLEVGAAYPLHTAWSTYVALRDRASDVAHQADLDCDLASDVGFGGPDRCVHAGELRMARMSPRAACASLTITDDLGLWLWRCAETADGLELFTTGLAPGRGLRDVVGAGGFLENVLRVVHTATGITVAESPPSVWGWPNAVVPLPDNGTGATAVLELAGGVYVLATSGATNGYNIAADGISVVTLADQTLTFGDSAQGNCAGDGTLDIAGERTILCGGNRSFLWLETRTVASAGAAVDSHISLNGTRFSRLNAVAADTSAGALIRCAGCNSSRFSGLELRNAGQQGLSLDGGAYNEVTSLRNRGSLSEGVRVDNGSSWNVIRGVDIADSGSSSIWSLVLSGGTTEHNKLSNIRVVDARGGGIKLENGARDNWLIDYRVHRQVEVSSNSCVAVNGPGNKLVNGVVSNCAGWGLRVQAFGGVNAFDNTVVGLLIASTNVIGAYVQSEGSRVTLVHVTSALNAQEGIGVLSADNGVLAGLLSLVNAEPGLIGAGDATNGDLVGNQVRDAMVLDNDVSATQPMQLVWWVEPGFGSGQRFDGRLWVSGAPGPAALTCNVNETVSSGQGLVDRTCTTTGADGSSSYGSEASTATLRTNVASSSVVVGPVTDDATSTIDSAGVAAASSITGDAWTDVASPFRTWGGLPGAAWGDGAGVCASGQCRIWDWRPRTSDTTARAAFGTLANGTFCPSSIAGDTFIEDQQRRPYDSTAIAVERAGDGAGDDDGVCEPGESCFNRFLAHAIEVVLDDVGDDDGLCESTEACIFAPNVGAYQGEGDYREQRCTFVDAGPNGVSGVTMYAYPLNGSG
ncbi:MAG: right-handed parallel beta-helix repeat-containing protein [Myxococcota bacterium]